MLDTAYSDASTNSWTPSAVDHDESQSRLERWGSKIRVAWTKTVGSVVEVGKLINQAKEDLGASFRELEERLPFHSSTATYLTKIAEHPVLSNRDYWPKLPSSYNTLYALCALGEVELIAFIDSGQVTPKTTLSEAKALTGKGARLKQPGSTSSESMRDVVLSIPESADFTTFMQEINNLAEKYRANLSHPMNKNSIGWWNRQTQIADVEAKIEEKQGQLQGITLEQLRMLERAVAALPKSKKDDRSPQLPEAYADIDQLAELLGAREITKKTLQKWCKDRHIPSRLALADVEHEVYIWEQVRLIAIQEDAKGAQKRLHAISQNNRQAEIKQLARTALNMVDAFEV